MLARKEQVSEGKKIALALLDEEKINKNLTFK
jgi:hypothetical protein